MSEHEEINITPAPGESLRDRLRAERAHLRAGAGTLDLAVPGWETVGIRYRTIPSDEFEQLVKRVGNSRSSSNLVAACKLIVRCCEAVLVRAEGSGEFEPLIGDSGSPFKLDKDLADYLGLEAKTAEEVVTGLFSTDRYPLAPGSHAAALIDWMRGREQEIDETLLGK